MGRHHPAHSASRQVVEHRHRQRSPLLRVRTSTQFVEQDKGMVIRIRKQSLENFYMAGIGRQRKSDALRIAHIHKNTGEISDHGAPAYRNVQTAVGHHREQADRLQRNTLAARIGSGHHQNRALRIDMHR